MTQQSAAGQQPPLPLTSYERRVREANPRDLAIWVLVGCIAAPVVYTWIVGWPPARPGLFVAGMVLLAVWFALVSPTQSRALRFRKLGPAGGVTLRGVLLLRVLFLGVRLLIAATILLQSHRLSWGIVVQVALLSLCDDPLKRYVAHRTLQVITRAHESPPSTGH